MPTKLVSGYTREALGVAVAYFTGNVRRSLAKTKVSFVCVLEVCFMNHSDYIEALVYIGVHKMHLTRKTNPVHFREIRCLFFVAARGASPSFSEVGGQLGNVLWRL